MRRYNALGINRYIMECKSDIYKKNARRDNELIDTLWNVNEVKVVRNKRPQAN